MKANNRTRVVLVPRDSPRLEAFTTVSIEDRKHAIATKYGAFWILISRRIV